jgi:Dolichyl-phosphate-mannose-protein mannosyltransferase
MNTKTIDSPPREVSGDTLPEQAGLWHASKDWSSWADSKAIAYLVFGVAYIIPNVILARQKLIWDDEFFTLYLSKAASWNDLWKALSTGADQHPPSFYYLTHLIFKVFGTTNVTLRLTAMFGFALACLCLYEIAREVAGRRWGLPAMLLPLTTPALYYATEARGYGLELGFVTFSLLMWIWATQERKRFLTVPALAIGLCCAVGSHYYALVFLFPLGVGELFKMRMRRSLDIPTCSALFAGLLPILLFAPLILRASDYSTNFWATPYWAAMVAWYQLMLGRTPLVLLAMVGLVIVLKIPAAGDWNSALPEVSFPVAIALAASALIPIVGVSIAKLVTHAYTERYFISALPGSVMLLVWGLRRIIRNDRIGPALATAMCLILFPQQRRDLNAQQLVSLRSIRTVATLLRQTNDAPIVISNITIFHKLSFYGQRDLANRLVYVADPHRSVLYLGQDTVDRGLLALTPWFPLKVVWWNEWWADHPSSLVYGPVADWEWVTFALGEIGPAELRNRDTAHLLFDVKRTTVPGNDHLPGDPSGKPMLYDKFPANGPPLCQAYMRADDCFIVDDPKFTAPIISYPDLLNHR